MIVSGRRGWRSRPAVRIVHENPARFFDRTPTVPTSDNQFERVRPVRDNVAVTGAGSGIADPANWRRRLMSVVDGELPKVVAGHAERVLVAGSEAFLRPGLSWAA